MTAPSSLLILLASFIVSMPLARQARAPFELSGQQILPGQRADFNIEIPAGAGDPPGEGVATIALPAEGLL